MADSANEELSPTAKVHDAYRRGDVSYLISALSDTEPAVRRAAVHGVGQSGDPSAVEPLCQLLQATDDSLKVLAIIALERIGDPRAVPDLADLATSQDSAIGPRVNAMSALGRLGDERGARLLASVVVDPTLGSQEAESRDTRAYRRWAAGRLAALRAKEAIPALEAAKRDAPLRERWYFTRAIRSLERD